MANITPAQVTTAGQAVTYTSASGGGDVVLAGLLNTKTTLLVRNASGGSITVTFTGVVPCSQGSTHNVAVACPIGDTDVVIPAQAVDPSTGHVAVGYSAVTSLTVAAIQ